MDRRGADVAVRPRLLLALGLLVSTLVALVPLSPSHAAPIVDFGVRFQANDNGSVALFGNNLMTCPGSDSRCAGTRAGTNSSNNNSFRMVQLDTDTVGATFNSSSSTVVLPADRTVLWAGLYWGARLGAGVGGVAGTGNPQQMSLRLPGATAYTTVTSDATFGPTTTPDRAYQEFADVTALVRAGGTGTYWGANVVAATGEDRYAGWSLVVVYQAPGLPLRNLTVFDGFTDVGRDNPEQITITGFRAPIAGPVETELGLVAYEGDFSTSGDQALLNDTLLSTTPLSRSNNLFNGTNDDNGTSVAARSPAYLNMLGYDRKNLGVTGIPNDATSATISLTSTGDRYFPGVVTTAIKLYAPDYTTSTKTVVNLAGREPAVTGDVLEYTLTFPNTGQDASTATAVADPVPPGVAYLPGSLRIDSGPNAGPKTDQAGDDQGQYDAAGDVVTFRLGAGATATDGGRQAPGDTTQVSYRVTVLEEAANTTVTNSAPLSYRAETLDLPFGYRTPVAGMPVTAQADLAVTKLTTPDPAVAGGLVTSTITVRNLGPNRDPGVTVFDRLPSGITFVSATPSAGSCAHASGLVTCSVGAIAVGAAVTVEVVGRVPAGFTGDAVVNVANSFSPTTDPNPGNDTAPATVAVTRAADLRVTKTAPPGPIQPGQDVPFQVTLTNGGPSTARNVVLTDLPDTQGLSIVGNDNPTACPSFAQCRLSALEPGASFTVTFLGRLASDFTGTSLTNTASAVSGTPDPNPSAAVSTVTVPVSPPQADLAITKQATPAEVLAGDQVRYRIVVANPSGPSLATGVVVTDTLPAGLTPVYVSTEVGDCTTSGQVITCDLGTLPPANTATITVLADVAPDYVGSQATNSVSVTTETSDPNPDNDQASTSTEVVTESDLRVTKTGTPAVAGQNVTFTVEVTNRGPTDTTGVVVTDALPAEYVFVSAEGPLGPCPAPAAGELTCPVGGLAVGATEVVTVTMAVPADFVGTATNVARVSGNDPDPVLDDNEAVFASSGGAQADLSITKTASDPVVAGGPVTWTIEVANAGPSTATDVLVTDELPPGVSLVDVTAPCTAGGPGVTCDLGTVDAGQTVSLTLTGTLDAGADPGRITNTAVVSTSTVDPAPSNDTTSVDSEVGADTDIAVTKTVVDATTGEPSAGPYSPGQPFGFVIQVTNNGPSVARDVTLFDRENLGLAGDIQGDISEEDCQLSDAGEVLCDVAEALAPGESRTVIVAVASLPDAVPGTYQNLARVATTTPGTIRTNNESEVDFTIGAPVADVTIAKTATPDPLEVGLPFSYTITPTNPGPSEAEGVVVVDTLPPGLTPLDVQATQGECAITGQEVRCELGEVTSDLFADQLNGRVSIVVSGVVEPDIDGAEVTNTARISTTTTPPPGGGAPNEVIVTTPLIRQADLSIAKTTDDPVVPAGGQVGYSLAVTNAGPSAALGVEVTDLIPDQLEIDADQTDPSCLPVGQPLVCDLGRLEAGASVVIRVVGRLPAGLPEGTLTNVATVSSATPHPNTVDNTSPAVETRISQLADLQLVKTADNLTPVAGETFTYTLTATNDGPSVARDVVLADLLPAGVVIDGAIETTVPDLTCSGSETEVRCTLEALDAGGAATALVRVRLPDTLVPGDLTNRASLSAATEDPEGANNVSNAIVSPLARADTAVRKSLLTRNPVAGQPLEFAIDVVNNGPQVAPRVVVSDSLAAGLSYASAEVVGGAPCIANRPEDVTVVTCEVTTLAVGETARVIVRVDPRSELRAVTNEATVGSAALDEISEDNIDDIRLTLAPPPGQPPGEPPPDPDDPDCPPPTTTSSRADCPPVADDPGAGPSEPSDPRGPGDAIPNTGSPVPPWLPGMAVALVLAGSALVWRGRRPVPR